LPKIRETTVHVHANCANYVCFPTAFCRGAVKPDPDCHVVTFIIEYLLSFHSNWCAHLVHCCWSICCADAPALTTTDVQIKETFSGSLNCIVFSNPASVITWIRQDTGLAITEGLVKGNNSLSLNFTDVSREDAGRYRCSANNGIGNVVYTDVTLVITCKFFINFRKQWLLKKSVTSATI